MERPLANKRGILAVCAILDCIAPLCPDCGVAAKKTSKRWAKCPKCGRIKIPRMDIPTRDGEGRDG